MSDVTAVAESSPSKSVLLQLANWKQPPLWLAYLLAFGVVAPLVCFGIVVRASVLGDWNVPLFAYASCAAGSLLVWLAVGRKSAWLDALLAGVLTGAVAFTLGCCALLVPLGFMAVSAVAKEPEIAALGLLGFAPPLACPVYVIQALRAFHFARRGSLTVPLLAAGLVGSLALPVVVHSGLDLACRRASAIVVESDRPLDELDLEYWRILARGRRWDELVEAYRPLRAADAIDGPRAKRIEQAYELATGKPIRWRFYD